MARSLTTSSFRCQIALFTIAVAISAVPLARAETFVTFHFEGVIDSSTSPLVNVGDRFVGTFTYDLDEPDFTPFDPQLGSYDYSLPEAAPAGMTYRVGSFSYTTALFSSLLVADNADLLGDTFFFASDDLVGPFTPPPPQGQIWLQDDSGTAFSSLQPPATLDLSSFSIRSFFGVDAEEGFFAGDIDVLRLVPEPTAVVLLLLTVGALTLLRRKLSRPAAGRRGQVGVLVAALLTALAAAPARADFGDELFKLTASDAAPWDGFGMGVALSGSTALVGAELLEASEDARAAYLVDLATSQELVKLNAPDAVSGGFRKYPAVALGANTAIVGTYVDNLPDGTGFGAAYVFDVATGEQLFTLRPNDDEGGNYFGRSVALSGNTAVVGAYGTSNSEGFRSGAAYLFDVTTGQQLYKLTGSDTAWGDFFGKAVAISDDLVVVGADGADGVAQNSGAAYVFSAATGEQLFKLTASDADGNDAFGRSVALSGNTAIVGAPLADFWGAAYVFDVSTGQQLHKLTASDGGRDGGLFDFFGQAVAISGNTAIVGAPEADQHGGNSGAAYLFDAKTGQELLILTASDAHADDYFGRSVAISGNEILVGAPGHNELAGAVYVFDATRLQILSGDYNGNGLVEQADLDLVLLNWGASAAPPPTGWLGDLPGGAIDQDELDRVLLNWGASLEAHPSLVAVPEPATLALALVLLVVFTIRSFLSKHCDGSF